MRAALLEQESTYAEKVKELNENIQMLKRQVKDKQKLYDLLNTTVESLNAVIPKLIQEKLQLIADVKGERERIEFLRNSMTLMKEKNLSEVDTLQRMHDRDLGLLE